MSQQEYAQVSDTGDCRTLMPSATGLV